VGHSPGLPVGATDPALRAIGLSVVIVSAGIAIPIFVTYVEQGVVSRFPTAVLSTGLMVTAILSLPVD